MRRILCNKYEVLKSVSEGGMGTVYLAKDLHLNRLVAIKIAGNFYDQGKAVQEKEIQEKGVFQEAEVLKKLSHPMLPVVTDFFREEDKVCLVMEYVEGITLEQHLKKFGRIETSLAVKWAMELADVLSYLHHQNPPVIYRDIKPSNIIIQPDGSLKLIDFGAAWVSGYGREERIMMGTPGYSAPEQWKRGTVTEAADVYGVGALLHEMLTYQANTSTFTERRPVREYDRSIPARLQRIIEVCLRKRPSERYQTMEILQRHLRDYNRKGIHMQEVILSVEKLFCSILFTGFCGTLLIPLYRGVEKSQIPFPFLRTPLLMLFLFLILYGRIRRSQGVGRLIRQEKWILLTEKKFPGIYLSVFLLTAAGCFCVQNSFLEGLQMHTEAGDKENVLWVEMRDEKDRKLLLKDGSVYRVGDALKLELPSERMPDGDLCLQIVAIDSENEIYTSRIFQVKAK